MKYMLLIYQQPGWWDGLSEREHDAIAGEVGAIMDELSQSGEWVGGEALAPASASRTVRVRDGVPAVTDGPFAEAKEHLAGYCLFDCDSVERATEIAARWPDARYNAVEIRPVITPDQAL